MSTTDAITAGIIEACLIGKEAGFAAGRLAGLREAAALHEDAAERLKGARTEIEQRKRRWHQNFGAAILALAERDGG